MPRAKTSPKQPASVPSLPFAPVMPPMQMTDPAPAAAFAAHGNITAAQMSAHIRTAYAAPRKPSPANALRNPTATLQTFTLPDLAQFSKEKAYSRDASNDLHLFFVGRDDVHEILKYILSRVSISLYLNMFGYDDDELNHILIMKALDPSITMLITLDKSQAGGVHEAALIAADKAFNLAAYNTHFVVGESSTNQISHTKGFVADGLIACEGSTNWSTSGEGTFVVTGSAGGPGYKAQNNTQSVITDRDTISRFQTELIAEHMTALAQQGPANSPQKPLPAPPPAAPPAAPPARTHK